MDTLFKREEISEEDYGEYWGEYWKRGKPFSKGRFGTFSQWQRKTKAKTSAYRRRIESYMRRHPNATLKEARGHG